MRAIRISAHNIKGRSFDIPLHPACVIHGGNFTGKSAVAVALRLGLSGFLPPPIGKTAGAIYAAIAGNPTESGEMSVDIAFDLPPSGIPTVMTPPPPRVSTTWVKTGGRVSVKGGPPAAAMPAILVDPRTFFGMTGPARMLAVFEACRVSVDADSIRSMLFQVCPTAIPDDARRAAVREVIQGVTSRLTSGTPPHLALKSAVEWIREIEKSAKIAVATEEGIINGLTWSDEVPEDLSTKVAEAVAAAVEAQNELKRISREQQEFDRVKDARAKLQDRILTIRSEIPAYAWDEEPPEPSDAAFVAADAEVKRALAHNALVDEQKRAADAKVKSLRSGICPTCGGPAQEAYNSALTVATLLPEPIKIVPLEAARDAALKAKTEAEKQRASWRSDRETVRALERELATHEASLASMPIGERPDAQALTFATNANERAKSVLVLLNEGQAKWEAYQQTLARRQASQANLANQRCALQVYEASVKALRARIETMVEESFGRVLDYTLGFTSGILNSDLEFVDGELGRRVSVKDQQAGCTAPIGSWISHESFSGTEEAVAYAAFSVAMAMQAQFRIVILDELGRMDSDRKESVLYRMEQLVRNGKIDQFIGIDTVPSNLSGIITDIPIGK